MLNQPRHRPQSPLSRVPEDVWRWRAWRPRLLHPRYSGPNPFDDQDSNDVPENVDYYRSKFICLYIKLVIIVYFILCLFYEF